MVHDEQEAGERGREGQGKVMSRDDGPNFCFKEMAPNAVQGMDYWGTRGGRRLLEASGERCGWLGVTVLGAGKGTDEQNQGELCRLQGQGFEEKGRRRGQQ